MLMTALSDAELRRLVDTEPDNHAAVREVVRRFVDAGGVVERLEGDIEMWENKVDRLESEIERLEERISELEDA